FEWIVPADDLVVEPSSWEFRMSMIVAALLLPPLACWAFYFLWRQGFPEAAERFRRERSRGFKTALGRVDRLGTAAPAAEVRSIVADYLRLHVALPQGEPTPGEIKAALRAYEMSGEIAERAEGFFRECDQAQFSPVRSSAAVSSRAATLLQILEDQVCASASR